MKKSIILVVSICFISVLQGQGIIKIDTAKSVIQWKGSNLFKFNGHYGTVKFLKGTLFWSGNKIMGGNFVADMNSIRNTDGKYNGMLVSHLKNEDFFDVEKYPTAELEIHQAIPKGTGGLEIDALLTIKGISRPIKFGAILEEGPKETMLKSKFIIDRTRWGISYESKGLVKSIKDDIISDAIEFEVILVLESGGC